jgi:hypothetical protein
MSVRASRCGALFTHEGGARLKETILESVEMIKVHLQVTVSQKREGRVGKQKGRFDTRHTTGVTR